MYASDMNSISYPNELCIPTKIKTKVIGVEINPKQVGRLRTRIIPSEESHHLLLNYCLASS